VNTIYLADMYYELTARGRSNVVDYLKGSGIEKEPIFCIAVKESGQSLEKMFGQHLDKLEIRRLPETHNAKYLGQANHTLQPAFISLKKEK
jgi:hypothetical protein